MDGDEMEPMIERREATDLCKWTLVGADEQDSAGRVQTSTQLLIRGKYKDCLALGRPLWDSVGPKAFRPPARASGWQLTCAGRDARAPELRFRLVKAALPFGPDGETPARGSRFSAAPPPLPAGLGEGLLAGQPLRAQEQMLLDDLLYCMLGAEGTYVRPVTASTAMGTSVSHSAAARAAVRFEIDVPEGADMSTVHFLRQLLPLCEHAASVRAFVEVQGQYEHGSVNHALCAAISELLREFSVKVGQLESTLRVGDLSIAKLWYHVQPSLDTMVVLHRVTSHVAGRIGGLVLNGIEEVMAKSSLTLALDLCEYLLEQASRPYFEMVSRWIYDGRLDDPYGEFFISESNRQRDERHGGPAADFWQKHFVLEDRTVPQFLAPVREKILHAGKYIYVFLSAAPGKKLPEPDRKVLLRYSRRQRECVESIDAAYRRASAALLGLFMAPQPEGLDLPGRLRSMRSFFFLGKADWYGQFMDTAGAELEQAAADVPLARLEGLLDLAIRASSAASDVYREDIFCGMHSFRIEDACNRMVRGHGSLNEDMDDDGASTRSLTSNVAAGGAAGAGSAGASSASASASAASATGGAVGAGGGIAGDASGVRCFTLKYRTSWPLSIVFSRALLLKYQMIFRHLLFCRYVERKLVEVWADHQYTKELGLDTDFSPSYSLRQRMLHFCREYIYYATVEVLEPQSHSFLAALSSAETVDEVLKRHELFLATCLRELLLTEREALYKGLAKVLQTCLSFAFNLHRFANDLHEGDAAAADLTPGAGREGPGAPSSAESRIAKVSRSTNTYLHLLSQRHYSNMISKFKAIFESQLQAFLRQIRSEGSSRSSELFLSNMLTRLDYNEYYSSVMTGVSASGPADAA
eukprot:TRINITY_DN18517_c0_g2_i1.p1 TRINITY_DN18517_c0_g2~~TRINITY_DN18517_c0_g2_i1.p1  ORF type:complete len:939 (-),score=233.35 TRINITY_DN18517_c0_g2_i1:43-2643(-)